MFYLKYPSLFVAANLPVLEHPSLGLSPSSSCSLRLSLPTRGQARKSRPSSQACLLLQGQQAEDLRVYLGVYMWGWPFPVC